MYQLSYCQKMWSRQGLFKKIVAMTHPGSRPLVIDKPPTNVGYSLGISQFEYTIQTGFVIKRSRVVVNVDCNFELKTHPDIERFIEFAYQQGVTNQVYTNDPDMKEGIKTKLRESYFIHLGLNTVPDLTCEKKMQDVVTWILLLFAFDNVIDNKDGKIPFRKSVLEKFVWNLEKKLRGNGSDIDEIATELRREGIPEKEISMAKIPLRLAECMQSKNHSFLSEAKEYLESSQVEMSDQITDVATYMSTRKKSGAIDTVVRLVEEDLPDYLSGSNFFQRLNECMIVYIWGVNDLGGAKEWESHEPSYLKIQTRHYFQVLVEGYATFDPIDVGLRAFNNALRDLVKLINENHRDYFIFKEKVLRSIESGAIFSGSIRETEFDSMGPSQQEASKGTE